MLLQEAGRGLQFSGATRDRVASLLFAMADHSGMAQLIDFLSAFNLLAQAQASERSVLSSAGFVPSLDERAGKRINLAYEYVFAHFTRPPNYAEIARKTGMSLSAFCHYFKRVTGRTLSAFVCEVRIGHARKLLIETDEGIAEIAYASGFESLSNFNRCFRALTQLSPKEFRRQHRNHSGSQSCV
jgi:AraC-like DNA-binding protein